MVFMITGIGVHDPPESVFTIDWNLCSRSNGIRVHDPPESAITRRRGLWIADWFRCDGPGLYVRSPQTGHRKQLIGGGRSVDRAI